MSEPRTFDPGRYLTKVSGADYLEVKWRLVWLREEHPDASIETQMMNLPDGDEAIFKATVTIPGRGSASGHGSETKGDFRDFLEKAETKAIGRALAGLGYGTQFCPDFDFGSDNGNVVDSPIDFASTRGRRMDNHPQQGQRPQAAAGQTATPRQIAFIQAIATERGVSEDDLGLEVRSLYSKELGELDRREASAYIERLQSKRPDNVTT